MKHPSLVAESLMNEKYLRYPTKAKICRCGDLQCHGNLKCHNCGGPFNIDPHTKTLREVIRMKADHQYGGDLLRSLNWFFNMQSREDIAGITLGIFKAAYESQPK
jgi:hypothetical protein